MNLAAKGVMGLLENRQRRDIAALLLPVPTPSVNPQAKKY